MISQYSRHHLRFSPQQVTRDNIMVKNSAVSGLDLILCPTLNLVVKETNTNTKFKILMQREPNCSNLKSYSFVEYQCAPDNSRSSLGFLPSWLRTFETNFFSLHLSLFHTTVDRQGDVFFPFRFLSVFMVFWGIGLTSSLKNCDCWGIILWHSPLTLCPFASKTHCGICSSICIIHSKS